MALAREKGRLLAWDRHNWLYLLDLAGTLQGQVRMAGSLVAAAGADDGSAFAAVGGRGEVWWLAPDFTVVWQQQLSHPAVAVALDSFGHYAAVADAGGRLHLFDREGREVAEIECPRPLHHLAFVPTAPFLIGSSDFGLVACLDSSGQWRWRDGLVAHVGGLAVAGTGEWVALACFSEGLQRYSLVGVKQPGQLTPEPCRSVAVSFDGHRQLVTGLSRRAYWLDATGRELNRQEFDEPPTAVVLGALGDWAAVALPGGSLAAWGIRPE